MIIRFLASDSFSLQYLEAKEGLTYNYERYESTAVFIRQFFYPGGSGTVIGFILENMM